MQAVVCTRYGAPAEVLQLKEVDQPVLADNRVLVRVLAASVNKKDLAPVRGPWVARLLGTGLRRPKRQILGDDFAGRVEAVGRAVTRFKVGDEVFGAAPGTFAEFTSAREDLVQLKPAAVSFVEAAAVPVAAITALQGLRKGQGQAGQQVLVYGATGGVGTFAVQLAKAFGAEVTAACRTGNIELVRSIGADQVSDYTREDFARSGRRYDLILAANGARSMTDYRRALTLTGRCVVLGGSLGQIGQALLMGPVLSERGGRQVTFMGIAHLNAADLAALQELLAAGKLKPLIDRYYPLSQAGQAVQYLEEGHARGKVVITIP